MPEIVSFIVANDSEHAARKRLADLDQTDHMILKRDNGKRLCEVYLCEVKPVDNPHNQVEECYEIVKDLGPANQFPRVR